MNFACIRPERAVSRPSGYSHVRSINQSSPFVNGAAIFPPAQQRKPFPRFFAETVSLSKKSGCAGLFRQMLKKCLRPGAQTPRPPGKAGRYELTLEDVRALQTSRKGFVSGLRRAVSEWYRIRRARVFEKIRFRVLPYSAVATAAACWPAIWPETNVQDCAWPPQGV